MPYLKRPDLRERPDGQRSPESILVTPSQTLRDYVADLGERAERVRSRAVDPTTDNMLKISSNGRAAALDLRLVDLDQPEDELFSIPTKLEVAADRIVQVWLDNRDNTYPSPSDEGDQPAKGALQIVFSDLGTPSGDGFNAYGHLKELLVDRGMDPDRVRFIHEANNDRKKALLFEQCRTGGVDVLIGSTSKMDRPGKGGGLDLPRRMESCLHRGSIPMRFASEL